MFSNLSHLLRTLEDEVSIPTDAWSVTKSDAGLVADLGDGEITLFVEEIEKTSDVSARSLNHAQTMLNGYAESDF